MVVFLFFVFCFNCRYTLGGYNGDTMVSSVEVFDPRNGSWMMGEAMRVSRAYLGSFVLGGKLYVIGGMQDNEVLDVVSSMGDTRVNLLILSLIISFAMATDGMLRGEFFWMAGDRNYGSRKKILLFCCCFMKKTFRICYNPMENLWFLPWF